MHFPSPQELQYFLEIAKTLNISRAAERLGIRQPTLSLAVQRLEHSMGTALLIRNKNGVRLTHTGQKLAGRAKNLIQEWELLKNETLRAETHLSGRYVLGCHASVALNLLPLVLPELLEENPGLEIELRHDLSRKITEEVISFNIDFGLVVNPTPHPDLVIHPLYLDEVIVYSGSGKRKTQDPTSGDGVLICDPSLVQSQFILKQLAKCGIRFSRTLTSSNLEVIASLVAKGAGFGILPGRVAGRFNLKPLKLSGKAKPPVFKDQHCLIYRVDAQKSKSSHQLLCLLKALIEKNA